MRVLLSMLFAFALIAAACSSGASPDTGAPPGETTAVVTTAPVATTTPTTTAAPATTAAPTTTLPSGSASATCINGWITPTPGTALRKQPLDLIRRYLGLSSGDLFIVETMRYFTGPEDVEIIAPRRDIERWYVEAHLQSDPSVSGRWIVAYVSEDINGVRAEAPAGTTGFDPGVWTMYIGDVGEGSGEGEAYDPFNPPCTAANGPYCECSWGVDGCSCADDEQTACIGIPPTVMGCLDGL